MILELSKKRLSNEKVILFLGYPLQGTVAHDPYPHSVCHQFHRRALKDLWFLLIISKPDAFATFVRDKVKSMVLVKLWILNLV